MNEELRVDDDGILWLQDCLVVPVARDIRHKLLEASHSSSYTMRPGSTKMYHDLRMHYWWKGMKKDVVDFVVKCLTCQQVKVEHQRPADTLQSLDILEWKWDKITIDLVTGLPRTAKGFNSI